MEFTEPQAAIPTDTVVLDKTNKRPPVEGEPLVMDIAAASKAKNIAGAIAHFTRDNTDIVLSAVGSTSVNQAVKAIAIARTYLKDDKLDLEFSVERKPQKVVKDVMLFTLKKIPLADSTEEKYFEMKASAKSTRYALAGAISNNVREKITPKVTGIGQKAVFRAISAIVQARTYLQDDGLDLIVAPEFTMVTLDNDKQANAVSLVINSKAKAE